MRSSQCKTEVVSRETLAELLWPDRGSEQSRQSLRQATFSIRRAFGDVADDIIKKNPAGTAISLSGVWVDAHCLEHADGAEELDDLAGMAKYCAREFLAGFPSVSNPFDEWVLTQRSRLGSAAACLLRRLASLQAQHSDFDEAIGTAKQLVALDPLREDSHRLLMDMYARAGRRSEALRQYEACTKILRVELNVDPDAETKDLANRLRKAAASRSPPSLGPSQPQQTAVANPKDNKKERRERRAELEVQTEAALHCATSASRRAPTGHRHDLQASERCAPFPSHWIRRIFEASRTALGRIYRQSSADSAGLSPKISMTAPLRISDTRFSHEDDAERAVRAALHTVQARPIELTKLEASAGIASGLVVVEDADKASGRSASGAAPYLAMQLQSYAKPDEVLISEATRRHLGRFFHLEFAEIQGKESGSPVRAYRVIRDRPIAQVQGVAGSTSDAFYWSPGRNGAAASAMGAGYVR